MTTLRNLPSIEGLLQTKSAAELIAQHGRSLTLEALRSTLGEIRATFDPNSSVPLPSNEEILGRSEAQLSLWTRASLVPVINASGVILHTNLGRAPLSAAAIHAIDAVSRGYSSLEYDLTKGERGSRSVHAESLLRMLTGAEAALVVNNNAAAVLLTLAALAARRQVVISRTQLVEIGGGFRVPDVMKQSGAKLLEVGATNRVHLSDYEEALAGAPAMVLRAHRSNFQIVGFTEEPGFKDLVEVAHRAGVPVVDDLGSGALIDTARFGLAHEPMVQESLAAGADLVCFSGDKLVGGPQAGVIVGKADLLAKLRRHPLARAVRADKTCLAALAATLLHYLKDEAEREIPIWRMISLTPEQLSAQAERWVESVGFGMVIPGESTIGGGSLPGELLPTSLLALDMPHPDKFLARLRSGNPPIIGRAADGRVLLDPRTVLPEQEGALLVGLKNALAG